MLPRLPRLPAFNLPLPTRCAPASLPPCIPPRLFVRNSLKRQTAIKSTTKHPRWNETFEFPVHVAEHQELVSLSGNACGSEQHAALGRGAGSKGVGEYAELARW